MKTKIQIQNTLEILRWDIVAWSTSHLEHWLPTCVSGDASASKKQKYKTGTFGLPASFPFFLSFVKKYNKYKYQKQKEKYITETFSLPTSFPFFIRGRSCAYETPIYSVSSSLLSSTVPETTRCAVVEHNSWYQRSTLLLLCHYPAQGHSTLGFWHNILCHTARFIIFCF